MTSTPEDAMPDPGATLAEDAARVKHFPVPFDNHPQHDADCKRVVRLASLARIVAAPTEEEIRDLTNRANGRTVLRVYTGQIRTVLNALATLACQQEGT